MHKWRDNGDWQPRKRVKLPGILSQHLYKVQGVPFPRVEKTVKYLGRLSLTQLDSAFTNGTPCTFAFSSPSKITILSSLLVFMKGFRGKQLFSEVLMGFWRFQPKRMSSILKPKNILQQCYSSFMYCFEKWTQFICKSLFG